MKVHPLKNEWYFFSIYYAAAQWGTLLNKGIKPFSENYGRNCWSRSIIHFGSNRGNYIGITCEVPNAKKEAFLNYFEEYFSTFLMKYPSRAEVNQNKMELYMDFPANSLCHSLHNFLPEFNHTFEQEDYHTVWHDSTTAMLKVLGPTELDGSDLFTAALYLNLLILLFNPDFAKTYLKKCSPKFETAFDFPAEYVTAFRVSESLLLEAMNDCKNILQGTIIDSLRPIADWIAVFNNFTLTRASYIEVEDFKEHDLLTNVLFSIRQQLGINNQTLLDYFLYRLLVKASY